MNPKMKDIASRANVSVSTVSKIINKETKNFRKETVDRVQKIIKEMGYAPNIVARSMVTKKTGLIGLILPDISNLYFAEMAKGIEIALRHMEYNMILCNCNDSDEREKAYIDIMRQKCVDGIIFNSGVKFKCRHYVYNNTQRNPICYFRQNIFKGKHTNRQCFF